MYIAGIGTQVRTHRGNGVKITKDRAQKKRRGKEGEKRAVQREGVG